MNPTEALEYLERVVEVSVDIDPGIREAIAVVHATLERERRLARALERITDTRFRHFSISWARGVANDALGGEDEVSDSYVE